MSEDSSFWWKQVYNFSRIKTMKYIKTIDIPNNVNVGVTIR